MVARDVRFSLLILNDEVRAHILSMLRKHENFNVVTTSFVELNDPPQREANSIILIDYQGILAHGVTVVSKLKTSCPECKLILLCSQAHRNMIERVMELGAYGCIVEPYEEWEFLTMVRLILSGRKVDKKTKRTEGGREGKKSQEK